MNPVSAALVTVLIVVLGRWSQKKGLEIKLVVGLMMTAIFLTILGEVNTKFARMMGVMVVIAALFVPITGDPYIVSFVNALGFNGLTGKAGKVGQ